MPKQVEYNGEIHEFPDDFSDADIQAALSAMDTSASPTSASPAPGGGGGARDTIANLLPAAGGLVGGLAGKRFLAGSLLAGVGGAAGEGYKQLLKHAEQIPGAAMDVGRHLLNPQTARATITGGIQGMGEGVDAADRAFVEQAGAEATGRGVMAGAGKLAKGAMGLAINPKQILKREFADIPSTLIEKRIPAGKLPLSRKPEGSVRAEAARTAARQSTDDLYRQADAAGVTARHADVLSPVADLTRKLKKTQDTVGEQPGVAGQHRQVNHLIIKYLQKRGGQMDLKPTELQAIKKEAQSLGADVLDAGKRKDIPTALIPSDKMGEGQFNNQLASGARQAIRGLGGQAPVRSTPTWLNPRATAPQQTFGQAIDAGEKEVQSLIGGVRGLKDAESRSRYLNPFEGRMLGLGGVGLFSGIGGSAAYATEGGPAEKLKNAITAIVATRIAMDPKFLSRAALGLTHTVPQEIMHQLPRAGIAALGE